MSDLTILIPAAGASSRMLGADKLLTAVEDIPLLRRTALTALSSQARVLMTLRPQDQARRDCLAGLMVEVLTVADAATGLSASLRAGAAAMGRGGLLILPADMPDITPQDLAQVMAAARQHPDSITRATASDGTPGHPVVFPPDLLASFAELQGDEGARSILQAHKSRLRLVPLPGRHALTDLDTPEDWAAWRKTPGTA